MLICGKGAGKGSERVRMRLAKRGSDTLLQVYGVDTKRLWNEDPGCSRVHDVFGPPRALGPRAAPDRQEKSTAAPGVAQTPPKLLEPGGHCERRGSVRAG